LFGGLHLGPLVMRKLIYSNPKVKNKNKIKIKNKIKQVNSVLYFFATADFKEHFMEGQSSK